ncbi:MAG TPA: hypothetical protein VGW76_08840, partial [Pyrinomonadaceae bacterium]|nr:hypothetical protein [Pyrinomonadaceae bacterium]
MRKLLFLFVVVLIGALAPIRAQERLANTRAFKAGPENEVRALWVVRNTLTSPEKIRAMVKAASDSGFNTIIVQVRGRGDAYYNSHREPRA